MFGQIIKKDIDFDSVSLKTFVDVGGLDQIPEVRKAVQVLGAERGSAAPLWDPNSAKGDLAEVTTGCGWGSKGHEILALVKLG